MNNYIITQFFNDDIEDIDASCSKCGHSPIRRRDCDNIGCQEGYHDEYDDDPINFPIEGESFYKCSDCKGTGAIIWCPECGHEMTGEKIQWDEDHYYE